MAVGVEVGRGNAQAGAIVGQSERRRGILEPAVSFVQKQGVVNPLRPHHGRSQKEVEPAVAIGVEGGDGRAEAGTDAADDRSRAGEVGRLDPALAPPAV